MQGGAGLRAGRGPCMRMHLVRRTHTRLSMLQQCARVHVCSPSGPTRDQVGMCVCKGGGVRVRAVCVSPLCAPRAPWVHVEELPRPLRVAIMHDHEAAVRLGLV